MRNHIALTKAGSGAQTGVDMKDVDARLAKDFAIEDPTTGVKSHDFGGQSLVRSMILRDPNAANDPNGTYLKASQVYQAAVSSFNGDRAKAQADLAQKLNPKPPEGYPKASDAEIEKIRKAHGGATGDAKPADVTMQKTVAGSDFYAKQRLS